MAVVVGSRGSKFGDAERHRMGVLSDSSPRLLTGCGMPPGADSVEKWRAEDALGSQLPIAAAVKIVARRSPSGVALLPGIYPRRRFQWRNAFAVW